MRLLLHSDCHFTALSSYISKFHCIILLYQCGIISVSRHAAALMVYVVWIVHVYAYAYLAAVLHMVHQL
jgi:hypothetical protein